MKRTFIATSSLFAAAMIGSATTSAIAGPDYNLLTTVAVPVSAANNQGGAFTAFDISYVDPITGDYYVADRSNAAVDIINGATDAGTGPGGCRDLWRPAGLHGNVGSGWRGRRRQWNHGDAICRKWLYFADPDTAESAEQHIVVL